MGSARRIGILLASLGASACLPDTSGFSSADLGRGADLGVADGGLDMFVVQSCASDRECRSPRNECQLAEGQCSEGECVYETRTGESCDDGDPCTEADQCRPTGCLGSPMVCSTPGPRCEGNVLVTASGGRCEAGACTFDESRETCAMGCAAGACETDPCVPSPWTLTDIDEAAPVDFSSDTDYRTDDSGNDHVVYVSDDGLHYLTRSRGGTWVDGIVESASLGALPKDPQLGFDASGAPIIAFARWNDEVAFATRAGAGWEVETVGDGSIPAATGTPDGAIHVVFARSGLQHAVRASPASDWTIAPIRRTDGGFTRTARGDTIRLLSDDGGQLHLVFTDFAEDDLSYGRFTTEWTLETIHPALVLPSAFDATLDPAGGIHVSFSDDAQRDLRYARRAAGGSGWSVETVHAAIERMGDPNAIAVTASGAVHIVYRDEDRREVRYAWRPAGGSFANAALEPDNGFAAGAYADDAGRVRFVYRAVPPVLGEVLRVAEVRECP